MVTVTKAMAINIFENIIRLNKIRYANSTVVNNYEDNVAGKKAEGLSKKVNLLKVFAISVAIYTVLCVLICLFHKYVYNINITKSAVIIMLILLIVEAGYFTINAKHKKKMLDGEIKSLSTQSKLIESAAKQSQQAEELIDRQCNVYGISREMCEEEAAIYICSKLKDTEMSPDEIFEEYRKSAV